VRGKGYTGFWWAKLQGKRPLGRLWRIWENNITLGLQELECGGIDWIDLA
jgi:hypothetical protein